MFFYEFRKRHPLNIFHYEEMRALIFTSAVDLNNMLFG
jgi:hypothetical protein